MNYATTARRPDPLAAIGAMGVPASFGIVLIAGLAVNHVIQEPIPNPIGEDIPFVVVTPEVIEDDLAPASDSKTASSTPTQTVTRPPSDVEFDLGPTAPITPLGPVDPGTLLGSEGLGALPPLDPVFDPVGASPRGNPANWITTADYRSTWIRRELTGVASFALQVDATGRVSDCVITGSTGHSALDRATCTLISQRAVFNPAKGTDGKAVAGSYSSSVAWTIPE